jgi:hypothetical protein
MGGRSVEEIRAELEKVMGEQIESLSQQTFLGVTAEQVMQEKERLLRIREISAEFLQVLKKSVAEQ